ncbi:hypothetical protein BFN03_14135 [Rhodococcus sp. WMMA185]|uniref:hypothetical protein n=1 Tax=Rhodococcus sp. WMMA185 TaxID=679318 RepID=UPI000877FA46|nr:hypothetical protein [Rhodococcus sp. WMMA185]AOW93399.1 hypothetical protein BFN03_14135 [Rhodococcus sp. WMMA185]
MKTSVRTAAIGLLAAPIAAASFAAPAQATEHEDLVALSATVAGNELTVSIDNSTESTLGCDIWYAPDAADASTTRIVRGTSVEPDAPLEPAPVTINEPGDYVVGWTCWSAEDWERWGTIEVSGVEPTAQPFPFTIEDAAPGDLTLDVSTNVEIEDGADVAPVTATFVSTLTKDPSATCGLKVTDADDADQVVFEKANKYVQKKKTKGVDFELAAGTYTVTWDCFWNRSDGKQFKWGTDEGAAPVTITVAEAPADNLFGSLTGENGEGLNPWAVGGLVVGGLVAGGLAIAGLAGLAP